MAFATNLNFDSAEHMISAILEEYRWYIETSYMVEEAIKQEFCCKGGLLAVILYNACTKGAITICNGILIQARRLKGDKGRNW
ncbi:MAG: hypothetical protein QXW72_08405 [Conexivisphaerales archaeon]